MSSSGNKKYSTAENQRQERKKTRMSGVHRYKENDSSKEQQQEAQALVPKGLTFIGSNSKHLPSKPRKVLYPAPSVSDRSVKMSAPTLAAKRAFHRSPPRNIPQNVSHEIQMKNNEINVTAIFPGFSAAIFRKAPITRNFQNSLRSGYQSFSFSNVYPRFTCSTFRSVSELLQAALPANNFTLSQNNTRNPSTGTRSTSTVTSTSSINGYKLNQITMSRNSIESTDSSSTASTTGIQDGNRNVEGNEDEVVYLYTVDTTPNGQIVEEIDLSSESATVDVTPTSSSRETLNLRQESKVSKAPVGNPGSSYSSNNSTGSNQKCSESKTSRKRKIPERKVKSIKREKKDPFEPRCCVCEVHYDELTAVHGYMCVATACGHLFCHSCSSRKDKKKCDKCGKKIQLYRKLFL